MTLFCDVALAQRIEAAERQLLVDACAHARRRLPDLLCEPIAGGLAVLTEPGSPLNKVAGIGFAAFDERAFAAIEAEHSRRAAPVQIELCTLGDPELAAFFTGRGYRLVGVENVCGRSLVRGDAVHPARSIDVEPCPAGELDRWIRTMVDGFAAPDLQGVPSHDDVAAMDRGVIARTIADFAAAAGVQLFFARRDGALAGAGALRLCDGVAQLTGAATLVEHRRRGVQSALLAHRLAFAATAGCDLAVVTTQPGSKSQQNMHRAGFSLLYSRNVLVRETG